MSLIYYVKYIQEFKQVITKHKMVKLGKDVKWTYPPRVEYKISMDSVFIKHQNETRLVVIIRNEGEE